MDVLTPEQRRRNMRGVTSKNTKLELMLRSALHAVGLRFRVHGRNLPGTPDIVFPRQRLAVFVHGCFWHGHACRRARLPDTRRDFWQAKIAANMARDERTLAELDREGWRTLVIWECALRGRTRLPIAEVVELIRRCKDEQIHSGRQSNSP